MRWMLENGLIRWLVALRSAAGAGMAWLVELQLRRPSRVLLVGAVLAWIGLAAAYRLELRTSFESLLPDGHRSATELRRLMDRQTVGSSIYVVLEGADRGRLRVLGDRLVSDLTALGPDRVLTAQTGIQRGRAFLLERAALFLSLQELGHLNDSLQARWDYESARATGWAIDDEPPPPLPDRSGIERKLSDAGFSPAQFPDGYFERADGTALLVVVRTPIAPGDLAGASEMYDVVRRRVEAAKAAWGYHEVRSGYAGDLVTGLAEYGAIRDDLMHVGVLGIGLILAVVFLYFARVRAIVAMLLTVGAGVSWTFGLTYFVIGSLNVATGFLFSIVAGNGINFGIILMARYFEERRLRASPDEAIRRGVAGTWLATLCASVAAAAAYSSLAVSDFRAFRDFAFIGAAGMIACWIATYSLLPAMLTLFQRWSGRDDALPRRWLDFARFGNVFAWLVPRAPRTVLVVGLAAAVAGMIALVHYVTAGPIEYDMRRLQTRPETSRELYQAASVASSILGAKLEGSMFVLCERQDQVEPLRSALLRRYAEAPDHQKPFQRVHALHDFVPTNQREKLPIVHSIADRLRRANARGFISAEQWAALSPLLPPANLVPFDLIDVPGDIAGPFIERDGTRGRLVLIEPTAGESDSDLRYLMRWAESFRETRLPSGEVVYASGRAVVFADILDAVMRDIPRTVVASLALAMAAVFLVIRDRNRAILVIATTALGVAWLALFLSVADIKINFFNFLALPITFGISVDYSVNLLQRHDACPSRDVRHVLRTTGGAVVLCSLTTILGYSALLGSINQAIHGLGLLAVLGEVSCLLSALVVLPAYLWLRKQQRVDPVRATARPRTSPDPLVPPVC